MVSYDGGEEKERYVGQGKIRKGKERKGKERKGKEAGPGDDALTIYGIFTSIEESK